MIQGIEHKKGGTVLRPSLKHFNKGVAFVPLSIGEHCMIEDNCVVSAAQIGNYVHLGADSIIGRRAVIKGFGFWRSRFSMISFFIIFREIATNLTMRLTTKRLLNIVTEFCITTRQRYTAIHHFWWCSRSTCWQSCWKSSRSHDRTDDIVLPKY